MSTGHFDEYKGSSLIEKAWVDQLIQDLYDQITYDKSGTIPYAGGSSDDWSQGHRKVFEDKSIPDTYKQRDGKVVQVKRYLCIHECVERTLMQPINQGGLGLSYLPAHAVATAAELAAVEADGFDVEQYTDFWNKIVPEEEDKASYPDVPEGLYLAPYEDEHDVKIERLMHVKPAGIMDNLRSKMKTMQSDPGDFPRQDFGGSTIKSVQQKPNSY